MKTPRFAAFFVFASSSVGVFGQQFVALGEALQEAVRGGVGGLELLVHDHATNAVQSGGLDIGRIVGAVVRVDDREGARQTVCPVARAEPRALGRDAAN